MKETEEETLHRYFDLIQNELDDFPTFENILKACKFYHQERLKSSLPSEQEINEKYPYYDVESKMRGRGVFTIWQLMIGLILTIIIIILKS